jgi:hypothetical protein
MASQYIKLPVTGGGGGGGGDVDSFNGRTGTVVSQAGDYSAAIVSNVPAGSISSTDVQGALNELDSDLTALSSTVTGLTTSKQNADVDLTALAGLSTTGLIARTGSGTASTRTLTAGANIAVSNGDGVSGNPTVAFSGVLPPASGGTGSSTVPLNGRIPIGNGTNYAPGLISVGSGLTAAFGPGTITLNLATTIPLNIDGGAPNSIYGGVDPINGGTP